MNNKPVCIDDMMEIEVRLEKARLMAGDLTENLDANIDDSILRAGIMLDYVCNALSIVQKYTC